MTSQDITALTTMLTDMQTQLQGEFDKINQRLDAHDVGTAARIGDRL